MTRRCDAGAVTALATSIAVLLCLVALVIVQAAGLIRLRHAVASAADLAALAATRASVAGDEPCPAAAEIARRNATRVVSCQMDFDVATVTTRGESATWWGHRWAFEQTARAAPSTYME